MDQPVNREKAPRTMQAGRAPVGKIAKAPRAEKAEALALDGGTPVRSAPLPGPYPGALLMDADEEKEVLEVLRSGGLFRYYGPAVLGKATALEKGLARAVGTKHALAVNSGTSALKCALFALGVGPGDTVLVPAYSYVATADVVLSLGARPVFVEIDESMTMSAKDLAKKAKKGVKAICVVHLFGVPADMAGILRVAKKHGIPVLEDAAQSLGATYGGKPVGGLGDVGITSFQLNKVITAGEGGAVFTNRADVHDRAVRLHDHGNHRDGEHKAATMIGEGFRISELSAAVLVAQLRKLPKIVSELRKAKAYLSERLGDLPHAELTQVPDPDGDGGVALTLLCDEPSRAARAVAALEKENVRALRQYGGKLLYHQAALTESGFEPNRCPVSEELVARTVFLGMTTTLARRDLDDVVKAYRKVFSRI